MKYLNDFDSPEYDHIDNPWEFWSTLEEKQITPYKDHFNMDFETEEMLSAISEYKEVELLRLYYRKQLEITGPLGTSIIEIRDRQVRFIDSPCRGKQCIMTGWLNKDGQLAACLPNGVTVQIIGRDQRFDAVNF